MWLNIKTYMYKISYKAISWGTAFLFVLDSIKEFDFSTYKVRYPNWIGLFNLLENKNLLSGLILVLIAIIFVLSVIKGWCETNLLDEIKTLKKKYSKIDVITENIKNLFDGFLVQISKKLKITEGDSTRLSLYLYDDTSSQFVPCGRYCPNPQYNIAGRPSYPYNRGCIGEGWKKGCFFRNHDTALGMNKKELKILTMPSELYAVMRIEHESKPIALLVVESIDKDRFQEENLKQILYEFRGEIENLILNLKDYIPTPNYAKQKGL